MQTVHGSIQGQVWLETKNTLKRRSLSASMQRGITCECCLLQQQVPIILAWRAVAAQNLFNRAVEALALPICLGMVCSAEVEFALQQRKKSLPKQRCEVHISVANQFLWQPVFANHVLEEQTCSLICIYLSGARDQRDQF